MHAATRPLFSLVLFACLLAAGITLAAAATPATSINLPASGNYVLDDGDDDTPAVTDRVARISFLEGAAKVRR